MFGHIAQGKVTEHATTSDMNIQKNNVSYTKFCKININAFL